MKRTVSCKREQMISRRPTHCNAQRDANGSLQLHRQRQLAPLCAPVGRLSQKTLREYRSYRRVDHRVTTTTSHYIASFEPPKRQIHPLSPVSADIERADERLRPFPRCFNTAVSKPLGASDLRQHHWLQQVLASQAILPAGRRDSAEAPKCYLSTL
jgi:hypothetical protein